MLLFPKETFTTTILADEARLAEVMANEINLENAMLGARLDATSVTELRKQLKTYSPGILAPSKGYGVRGGGDNGDKDDFELSTLDKLLHLGDDDEDEDDFAPKEVDGGDVESNELVPLQEMKVRYEDLSDDERFNLKSEDMSKEQWAQLKRKYVRPPINTLERERDSMLTKMETSTFREADNEKDLSIIRGTRDENEVIIRARLSVRYEEKEAARRQVLWRSRDIYTAEQMPDPELKLVDERESSSKAFTSISDR
eukprot:CAMPEP_0119036158 /NCGR_PEP_ID=MMETSP1177-20130426/3687_1 /TAXON_ID=2985 /ORGANISM="Ochromonas sp, Strain CCMP1899" /LENGTH=255 /DNA_ID=CAMNT_0006995579 /DNA_START=1273 /DNA_END=2040 /DNA_ORIENTATION=-